VSQDIVKAMISNRIMDNWAVEKFIDLAVRSDDSDKLKAKLKAQLCAFADELAGPNPSPVERVLAETAATAWFAHRMHEAHFAASAAGGEMTIAQSEHSQRRIDRAHRRLLSTLKTLAAVRRLTLPALQINVASQQVNQLNTGGTP
jgi:hypothetical protein